MFKARGLLHHSTEGSRVIKKKKKKDAESIRRSFSGVNFISHKVTLNPFCRSRLPLKVVLQTSTAPQIRQLILHCYQYEEYVDTFVLEMTFEKRL